MVENPQIMELYDSRGVLVAVITNLFNDDLWGITTKGDPDFNTTLVQLGLKKLLPEVTIRKALTSDNIDNLIIKG